MTPTPETADIAGLVERLHHASTTAANDDLSAPMSDQRRRHVERFSAMVDAATALQSLSAELAEARRDLATKEHMWLYECEKHAEWLEKFMAEKTRATTAEAEARAMREALEAARKYLTSAHMAPMPGIIGVQNPDSDIVAQIDRALGGSNAE